MIAGEQRLLVRSEVLDFGTLPLPLLDSLTPEQILKGFDPWTAKPDAKLTADDISNILSQSIPNFGPKDAFVLFQLYKITVEGEIAFLSVTNPQAWSQLTVKARPFCMFLYLQSYRTKSESQGNWQNLEGMKSLKSSNQFSPLNSPRSRSMRTTSAIDNTQNMISFVKSAIVSALLKIASGIRDFKSKEPQRITPAAFEHLSVLLRTPQYEKEHNQSLAEFLGKETDFNTVASLIDLHVGSAELETTINIYKLTKSVTVEDQTFCKKPILKIHSCEDSFIYINASVEYVSISNCTNCTIYVAAVRRICSVDKCERINLTCSTNLLRIGNTIDSKLNFFSTSEPILFGDNKSIVMGPNNANSFEMIDKMKKAEIPIVAKSMLNFNSWHIFYTFAGFANTTITTESPKEFHHLVLPDEQFTPVPVNLALNLHTLATMDKSTLASKCFEYTGTLIVPFLAPQEYKDKIMEKENKMKEFREKMAKAGLTPDQMKVLKNGIQAHFLKWLTTRPEHKELMEVLKYAN